MDEKKNSSKLSQKTKQELLNIIFRKDAREVSLQEEIKELNSQIKNLHLQIDKDYTTVNKNEKNIKVHRIISIVQTIALIVVLVLFYFRC